MKIFRIRLASLLVVVSAGSLALLQSTSGLARVSGANTDPETQGLYRRDHGTGHRKHHQHHHGHHSHTDDRHKHPDKEGKSKQDGPHHKAKDKQHHHKAKDKQHHHKHHKNSKVPTYKISLVCNSVVVDSIKCPVRPIDLRSPPSSHAMNNGAAIVYINMQEPCSKDLPPLCSAALAMAMTDESKAANLVDDTALIAKAEGNPDLHKRNRHGRRHRHRGHHGHGQHRHATQKHHHDHRKHKHRHNQHHHGHRKHHHGHHKHSHSQHRHNKHCHHHHHHHHNHDKNKHPYKDLCVAVGDFCGNKLYGCDFVATTQYRCDAIGERPKPIAEDSALCGGTNACLCPVSPTGLICGSDLPKECNAYKNSLYDCSAGAGTIPKLSGHCEPGLECKKDHASEDATCKPNTCECYGEKEVCSESFPVECGFEKNTIYKCTQSGKPEKVEECPASKVCISHSDGAVCWSDECKCQKDGLVCGGAFPPKCKLQIDALYKCTKGGDPIFESQCVYPDSCSSSAGPSPDKCIDGCTCKTAGTFCTSTFPPECKLPENSLVECSGPDAKPSNPQICEGGTCIVIEGNNKCSSKCTCPGTGPVCGSDLPKECNAKKNTIYYCPGGIGSQAEELSTCDPGTICVKKGDPEGAVCGSKECSCFGDAEVCSDAFPKSCGLESNAVYKCTSSGKPEKKEDCNGKGYCVKVSDGAVCKTDKCKCPSNGDVCGKVFPLDCKIPTGNIYTCARGEDPVLKEKCSTGCISTVEFLIGAANGESTTGAPPAKDVCIKDPCMCHSKDLVCGSTFPETCNFPENTLYECDGINSPPRESEKCADSSCIVLVGQDECDRCFCPTGSAAKVCGSMLPKECHAVNNAVYDCSGGSKTKPRPLGLCKPGLECISGTGFENADCGSYKCDCIGDNEVCSNTFPESCKLDPNTIYKCTPSGFPIKVSSCNAGETCITVSDGSICRSDNCKCTSDGVVCGDAFPSKCHLRTDVLYNCKKGDDPALSSECEKPGRCFASKSSVSAAASFKTNAADKCVNGCICGDKGAVCTSTFPPECNLPADSTVECSGYGATPKNPQKCENGACVVNNGDDKCSNNKCTCPGDTPVCGYGLPKECNANPNTIYYCPNGKGTEPKELTECKPGTICNKKEAPIGAACGGETCECPGDQEVCSNMFPDSCGLQKNAIYKCTRTGQPQKIKTCKDDDACVILSDGAVCIKDDCKCPTDGDVCGSAFPQACRIPTGDIYSCIQGESPVLKEDCGTGGCIATKGSSMAASAAVFQGAAASDKCSADPCKCQEKGDACGSTFPEECKFPKGTLYECSSNGAAPTEKEKCGDGKCTVTAGNDRCQSDKCLCPAGGTNKICGSQLPKECHADLNGIYDCSAGGGTRPIEIGLCPPGVECVDGAGSNDAFCGSHNCDCTGDLEVCSNAFPKKCGLQPNTIYKCTDDGRPARVTSCKDGETCVTVAEGSICRPDDCKCTSDGVVCGDAFPSRCNLKTSSLYDCKKGTDPVFKSECNQPGRCTSAQVSMSAEAIFDGTANDRCIDGCTCGDKGKACTSTFPPKCNLPPESIVDCTGSGAKPTNLQKCENGACVVSNGEDRCSNNKCTCPGDIPVCGSDLPKECNANPNTIYYCPNGKGTEPKELTECKPGTICNKKEAPIGAACGGKTCECPGDQEVCSHMFPDSCGLEKNAVYKCTSSGKPTMTKDCKDNEACVTLSDGAICTTTDCKCPTDGDVCGGVFPPACRIPTGDIYSCVQGGDPVLKEDCGAGGCIASKGSSMAASAAVFQGTAASDKCIEDPCKCQEKGDACGSTFPEECKFPKDILYGCSGNGATPTEKVKCAKDMCIPTAGDDKCGKCLCPAGGTNKICGSQLPEECNADLNGIYDCSAGGGTRPVKIGLCPPGIECVDGAGSNDAFCGSHNCDCIGNSEVCSNAFPKKCGLQPNTIYKCTPGGRPAKVTSCKEGEACITVADGSICRPDDCKCTSDGVVCGDAFPSRCNLKTTSLYDCKKGEDPVFMFECNQPGRCTSAQVSMSAQAVFKATANDRCIDGCTCGEKGKTCTSTFPPKCNLPPESIVDCTGSGAQPTNLQKCENGACVVSNGEDRCSNNKCTCPGDIPVCGSDLPKECNANPNTIYYCPNGKGTEPKELTECKPGTICNKKEAPIGAACGGKTCECPGDQEVCSHMFPDSCGLEKNAVYKCTSSGKPTMTKDCKDNEACVTLSDGAICTTTDCKCPTDGDICGGVFPPACRIPTGDIYSCVKGGDPVLKEDCGAGGCIATKGSSMAASAAVFQGTAASDKCIEDPCKCQEKGDACGSTFPEECKFPKDTLYDCSGNGATPTEKVKCAKDRCIPTAGDDKCEKCLCPTGGTNKICGSQLPEECNATLNSIYDCSAGGGTRPVEIGLCPPGIECVDGAGSNDAFCGSHNCDCIGNSEVCSNAFPKKCGLQPNTIYKCTPGGRPAKVTSCKEGEACITVADGSICRPDDCKCTSDGVVCGDAFPSRCNLKTTSLYDCKKGADPVFKSECNQPGRCTSAQVSMSAQAVFKATANDRCIDGCTCGEKGKTCTSTFPPKCNLPPESIVDCTGSGAKPTNLQKCENGACVVSNGEDRCSNNKCTCPGDIPVCGSDLPKECNANPNTIYYCPNGKGTEPKELTECKPGTICNKKEAPIGAACGGKTCECPGDQEVCSDMFPDSCGLEKNAVYKCTSSGKPTMTKDCKDNEACVTLSDGAICTTTDCKCPTDGDVCGGVFPPACRIPTGDIYSCVQGGDPVLKEDCGAGGCIASKGSSMAASAAVFRGAAASDKCIEDPCKCQEKGDACGSTFPEECKFPKDILYGCSGNGATPTEKVKCVKDRCIPTAGNDKCERDPCTCKDDNATCGSVFPSECGMDPNTVFKCTGAGSYPTVEKVCETQCIEKEGPDECGPNEDECKCKDNSDICGSQFPSRCNYDFGSLYKCSGKGSVASNPEPCSHGPCLVLDGDDECTPEPCLCEEAKEAICGKSFGDRCALDEGTLYECSSAGATPKPIVKCEAGCEKGEGDSGDVCKDPCVCHTSSKKKLCGSELPEICKANKNTIYHCPDGEGSKPLIIGHCTPGLECVREGELDDANCGSSNCECNGDKEVCSNSFPEKCGLDPNTIYKCTAIGQPIKVTSCKDGETCIAVADGSICRPDDCKCTSDGVVCGDAFPPKCSLGMNVLYDCKKGEDPILKSVCDKPGRCFASKVSISATSVFKATAADECFDGCTCGDKGIACTSTFPPECNLPADSTVECSGSGTQPTNPQKCDGYCIVSNGDDRCSLEKCTCPGESTLCGFDLPKECNAKSHIVYHCPGGKGTKPEELSVCKHATICIRKDDPDHALCGVDNCECFGDHEVCSSVFPDSCGFDKSSVIYKCTPSGKPEKKSDCHDDESCVTLSNGAVCAKNDCKCRTDGDVCGAVFPRHCMIPSGDMYSCIQGEDPVLKEHCGTGGCITTKGSSMAAIAAVFQGAAATDKCVEDPCRCQEKNLACGSTFPEECNLSKDTLYECSAIGEIPQEKEKCDVGKCVISAGDNRCEGGLCACKDGDLTCGSAFPTECRLDPKTLYNCITAGSMPTVNKICQDRCIEKDGPDECSSEGSPEGKECQCQDNYDICGSVFPLYCKRDFDTLYKCSGNGTFPSVPQPCTSGQCLVHEGDDKCSTLCICREAKESVCGKSFDISCGYGDGTLYECASTGATPKPIENCKAGCEEGEGDSGAVCKDPCVCPTSGEMKVCGSELPAECKADNNAVYLCPGGSRPKPSLIGHCMPGVECVHERASDNASCGTHNCDCVGNHEVCSDFFPRKCGLEPHSVYKCSANGKPEKVTSCNEGETCITVSDGSICRIDDCKCLSDGPTCGEAFPARCNIPTEAIYDCRKGEEPVLKSKCEQPGRCSASKNFVSAAAVFKATSDDKCVDGCTCEAKETVCAWTFPPQCNLPANSLVECSGPGTTPTNPQICENNACIVNIGNDRCSDDKCTCVRSGLVCGFELPAECNANNNTVYNCAGQGSRPEALSECKSGTECIPRDGTPSAVCGSKNCDCYGDHLVCSVTFPESCGFDKNSVYKCTSTGRAEKVEDCKEGQCVKLSDTAVCMADKCKCPGDVDICGALFPLDCKIPTGNIYTCVKGEDPVLKEECPEGCIVTARNLRSLISAKSAFEATEVMAKCIENPCKCRGKGLNCGSSYPEECGYDKDTVYECVGVEEIPREKEKCAKDKCLHSVGDDRCDKCLCPTGIAGKVCGSKLPKECNADKNTVYDCSAGANTTPMPLGACKPGIECVEGIGSKEADCGSLTCDCTGNMEVCSNSFPESCKLDPNTIYKCTAGGRPTKASSCKEGETCITVAEGSICRPDDCKCTSDGVVCGDAFPSRCNLKTNTLYDCTKGEDPVLNSECENPGRCFASKGSVTAAAVFKATADDKCVDGCICGDKGTVCTSTFPPVCNLPADSTVECSGYGATPKNPQKCENGACVVNNGDDKCSNNKCTCPGDTPVCGYGLPKECNANPNTIYYCPNGKGTEPKELTECKPGTICNKKEAPIGAACGGETCECPGDQEVCSNMFPDSCGLQKNAIYKCTRTGQPQKIKTCKDDDACVTLSDGAVCIKDDCKCPTDGDVCGSAFPQACRIPTGDIYSCIQGEDPVLEEDCGTGGCIATKGSSMAASAAVFQGTAASDKCVTDPCSCQEKGDACGSTFPEECNLSKDTLYGCSGNGAAPTEKEICGEGTCIVTAGNDRCQNAKCICPAGGTNKICGSQLPEECNADLNGIYDCSAGGGTRPAEIGLCPPGVECVDGAGSNDAFCGSHNCDCTGDLEVCSNAFPKKCGLQPNTIYKCTPGGRPAKVTSCKEGEACITVADGSICRPDDCKCTSDGVVCGDAFPSRCNLKTSSLYDCKKGEDPIFKSECNQPGRCTSAQVSLSAQAVFKATANDRCIDGCTCGDKGKACTSTFPPKCNLPPESIVDCTGSGAQPTNLQKCENGACVVSNGEDRCSNNKCTCPGDIPVCGSDLPKECNANPNTIYYCPNGKGTEPKELTECKPGTICNKKEAPIGAACGGKTCECPGDQEVCSNMFPDSCGLEKNAIYKCTSSGKPMKVKDCKDNEACVTLSDGAICTTTDCKCPTDGDVCGSVFPPACRIPTGDIYSCVQGGDPVLKEDCDIGGCISAKGSSMATGVVIFQRVAASDKCIEDPCKCQEKGDACGSTFPEECKFPKDTLYDCSGNGATPTEKVKCAKDMCIPTAGDDKCEKCLCPTGGTNKICGSQLPEECNATLNSIYDCSTGGDTRPVEIGLCPPGIECVDGAGSNDAFCGSHNCDCIGNSEVCSNAFPKKCGLQPNTIYKCTPGGRPAKVTSCKEGEACITVADGSICRPDDCKCTSDGVVCGDAFPSRCNLKTTSLYDCKKGADPVFKSECNQPGRCTSAQVSMSAQAVFKATANDRCIDGCTCGEKGKTCTSTFPPKCNLPPESIVDCTGSGAQPTNLQKCENGACVVSNGEDRCSNNKCTCPGDIPVCGSDLPKECNANPNTIYYCPNGKGTEPKELTECKPGTICNKKEAPIGAACGGKTCECPGDQEVCPDMFPDSCGLEKNAVYKCTSSGKPMKVKDCKDNEACVTLSDGAICTTTDCKCPTDGDVCGSVFPPACRIPTGDIYSCVQGGDPVLEEDCGIGGCIATKGSSMAASAAVFQGTAASDKCIEDPCKCQEKGDACGSTFPEECKFPKDTLYGCSGNGATPTEKMTCSSKGCVVTAGDDVCGSCLCPDGTPTCGSVFGPECNKDNSTLYVCSRVDALPSTPTKCAWGCDIKDGPDKCNTDCLCKNGNDVCGSVFPSKCGYKSGALYKCSGALADPSAPVDCAWGCVVKAGPDMCNADCLCKDTDDVCGSDFPDKCGYTKDSLYKCSGKLADPSSPSKCKWGCDIKPGSDKCNTDCLCKDKDDVCGSIFPAKCNLQANSLYKCSGALADPSSPVVCTKGCDVKDGPDNCNTDCLCKDKDDVCGSAFPTKCGLRPNSLYKCSGALADPLSPVACTKGCDVKDGPDKCNTDCLCKDKDDVCGSVFPAKCNLQPNSLYKCSGALADPSSPVVCTKGCDVKDGPDICITDCLCKNGEDVCGSQFPTKCGLRPNSLYKCPGALADPSSPVACTKGCDVKDGPDKCNTDCLCKNGEDVCGSEFPPKCNLQPNSLYKCSGALADPSSPVVCTKGCDVKDGPDKCNIDCLCKNGEDVCGSVFPAKCNLQANSLYKCSGALADPSSPVVCTKGCDVKDGPDNCNTDCLCKDKDDVCGSAFPTKCGLRPNSLYKCSGALADPLSPVACTKGCDVKDGPDKCNTDCLCKDKDDVCGSVFPAKCGLRPNSLYKCSGALADPSSPVACTKGCDVKDGPDKCNTDCLCKNGDDVCGSQFPSKCNLQPDSLYKCSGALADPSSPVVCTKGCDVKDGPDNCNTDCLCKDKDDVCGSVFPTKCGLRPNSLYKCSGALADPSSPVACTKGCDVKDGPDMCNADCLCKDKDDVCGSAFPAKCGFEPNSLYKCSGALANPSTPQTCTFGPCLVIDAKNDICTPDPCLCTERKKFCSNASTSSCGFSNNTILECTATGAIPQVVEKCRVADTCVEDPVKGPECKCMPVESGQIINLYSSKCVAVEKLAVGEPVVIMNCSNEKAFKDWHIADGKIKTYDNQFCFGYTLSTWPADNPMVVYRCDSNEKTTLGWSIVNRETIRSGEGNLCVDIAGPVYDDGNPIIAYPCHGGENQQWILPSGWGCREPRP